MARPESELSRRERRRAQRQAKKVAKKAVYSPFARRQLVIGGLGAAAVSTLAIFGVNRFLRSEPEAVLPEVLDPSQVLEDLGVKADISQQELIASAYGLTVNPPSHLIGKVFKYQTSSGERYMKLDSRGQHDVVKRDGSQLQIRDLPNFKEVNYRQVASPVMNDYVFGNSVLLICGSQDMLEIFAKRIKEGNNMQDFKEFMDSYFSNSSATYKQILLNLLARNQQIPPQFVRQFNFARINEEVYGTARMQMALRTTGELIQTVHLNGDRLHNEAGITGFSLQEVCVLALANERVNLIADNESLRRNFRPVEIKPGDELLSTIVGIVAPTNPALASTVFGTDKYQTVANIFTQSMRTAAQL